MNILTEDQMLEIYNKGHDLSQKKNQEKYKIDNDKRNKFDSDQRSLFKQSLFEEIELFRKIYPKIKTQFEEYFSFDEHNNSCKNSNRHCISINDCIIDSVSQYPQMHYAYRTKRYYQS